MSAHDPHHAALTQWVESDASNVGGAGSTPACRSTPLPGELISEDELDALRQAARRYETLRRLNVPQFQALFMKALNGEKSFDEWVDELGNHGEQP